jgi:hypothetical protein
MTEEEIRQTLLGLLESIDRNAQASYPDDVRTGELAHTVVVGLDARCRGLFRSAFHLLRENHAEEAAILCRTLFSDSLLLGYFHHNQPTSEQLAVRFMRESLQVERGLVLAATSYGAPPQGRGLAGSDTDLADLDAYATRIGMRKIKKLPNEKAMAEAIGRPNYYYFYQWASAHVHTTRVVLDARVTPTAEGGLEVRSTGNVMRTWVGVAVFAGELFSYGHTAACYFMGFDTADSVEAFRRHVHGRLRDVARASGVQGAQELFGENPDLRP